MAYSLSHSEYGKNSAMRLLAGAYLSGVEMECGKLEKIIKKYNWCEDPLCKLILDELRKNQKGPQEKHGNRKSKKILFIDDEGGATGWSDVLELICDVKGYGFEWVETIKEALNKLKVDSVINRKGWEEYSYALTILDLVLPNTPDDGVKALEEIKEIYPDLPVIMLTVTDEAMYTRRCLTRGAIDYFVKQSSEERDASSNDKIKEDCKSFYKAFWGSIENSIKPNLRELHRKILFLEVKTRITSEIIDLLKEAYYFLTVSKDFKTQKLLVSQGSNTYGESINSTCRIIQRLAEEHIQKNNIDLSQYKDKSTGWRIRRFPYSRSTKKAFSCIWRRRKVHKKTGSSDLQVEFTVAYNCLLKMINVLGNFQ